MAHKQLVDKMIAENKVIVFSKTYCPFCNMAKDALKKAGLSNFTVLELEDRSDCSDIQDYLKSKTGSRTVSTIKLYINSLFSFNLNAVEESALQLHRSIRRYLADGRGPLIVLQRAYNTNFLGGMRPMPLEAMGLHTAELSKYSHKIF